MVRNSKKRKRDPARPKRAMTPFLYFACEQRAILKSNGEKMTLPVQSRRIAALWKLVAEKDRTVYIAQAEKDKARYRDQMSRYEPPKKIKRPRSSYAFFMKNVRQKIAAENPDKNPRELMSDIATVWHNISDGEKSKYEQMAKEDKNRYEQEKAQNTSE
jgi:high mobility group protein B2